MKTILGLDLGSNSIGWALIKLNSKQKEGKIVGTGSRIIPMDAAKLGDFEKGNPVSATAITRGFRSTRRLYARDTLRRERLHRVLNILGFLPEHYSEDIDFDHRLGQFKKDKEPKLPYKIDSQNKFEFLFKDSFEEMVTDFRAKQPHLFYFKSNGKETKIPYDWTIYYLRKKALTQKIEKEELAWIILNFNQKRGYYQLRGEEVEVDDNKNISFEVLKVEKILDSGEKIKKTDQVLYDIYFQNGWKYDKQVIRPDDWKDKTKEFIVTTSQLATGEIKRTYKSVDSEKDWIAIKQKAEQDIITSGKMVGEYIYDTLLQKPYQKIRGKLIRTIERENYKKELSKILQTQLQLHPELNDKELYTRCIEELYPNNEPHKNNIANHDFHYLFIDDIIFYQRPLKSKKYLIDECPLELRWYKKEDGTIKKKGIKCIAKSNPLFQEFRLLQWLKNLKIYRKEDKQEVDITNELLPTIADKELLFEWLNERSNIDQKTFLKYKPFKLEEKIKKMLGDESYNVFKKDKEQDIHTYYRWNYVEDKPYQLNETRGEILKYFKKAEINPEFLDSETEMYLWHILYSVEDSDEIKRALEKFAEKYSLHEGFVTTFKKYPRINKEYGAYSAKAIKKLLPLMRFGKWWSWDAIDKNTLTRIDKLITGEYDEKIKYRVREKAINLQTEDNFQDLPLWLTNYIIYDRHSESSTISYWKEASDITLLKQHSLRNPIVEMVINETLQTVKDIWEFYGDGKENFFDKIHVELGREMKSPKAQRETTYKRMAENEKTNIRMKALLVEFFNDTAIENVRPFSPMQQEMLKIYEEGIYLNPETEYSSVSEVEIDSIRKKNTLTSSDLKRYKLWLEQGYMSPYTGEIISLSKLFTPEYQIEHIIPQTRFFDDSFSNKVICEAEVNTLKGNQLAFEFINNNKELKIELNFGKSVTLLHPEVYEKNVNRNFGKNRAKMNKLLMEEIPDKFIERQLNDTRYISKTITSLLSNIVREEGEQ